MRAGLRSFSTLLAAVAVATCSDAPVGAGPRPASAIGRIGFEPVFNERAAFAAANARAFGISYDDVRLIIRGYPDTTVVVRDTTVGFTPDSHDLTLNLSVPIQTDGQLFSAALDYTSRSAGVVFHGSVVLRSYRPGQSIPVQPQMSIDYVGPGSDVQRIEIAPDSAFVIGDASTSLTVAAFDKNGESTDAPPLNWSSSDASIVSVTGSGTTATVQGKNVRGSATITALTPTGVAGSASIVTGLPAASIALISGGGQTGAVHSQLAEPAIVEVRASDGIGVPGVSVLFAAPTGGSVGTPSVVTDATGRASTTMTLGTATGPQAFAATAGTFAVAIPATATAGSVASMTVVSGAAQTDTIRARLTPLTVRLIDAFGNAVANAAVTWTRVRGSGTLASATTTTNSDGVASNTYTLGTVVGSDSVAVAVGDGPSTGFVMTTRAGTAAAIVAVSGGDQTAAVRSVLAPFVVRVTDAAANPVAGVVVGWTAVNGALAATSTTASDGQTSNTMTLGGTAGVASATASIAGGHSVTFSATATAVASVPQLLLVPSSPTTYTRRAGEAIADAPAVKVANADGSPISGAPVRIVVTANGVTAGEATLTTDVNGLVSASGVPIPDVVGSYSLTATSTTVPGASVSVSLTVTPGSPEMLVFAAPAGMTSYSANAGAVVTPAFTVAVRDRFGNATTAATPITVALTAPNGATLHGTTTANAVDGVATFSDLSIDLARTGYTLTARGEGVGAAVSLPIDIYAAGSTRIVIAGGNNLSAAVGTATATPPRVRVLDANDSPVNGRAIAFTVKGGGGSVAAPNGTNATAATVSTDANGYATLGNWTLGASPGSNTLEARLDQTSAVVFTATATSNGGGGDGGGNDGARALTIVSGNDQTGTVGTALPAPLVVKATNATGAGLGGVVVTWSARNGSLAETTTTGPDGTASNVLTLGTAAGSAVVTASVADVPAVTFTATATAGGAGQFAILAQPTDVVAGATMSAPRFALHDASGNPTTATNAVTIALGANPGGATLGGTTTRAAVSGVVTFDDLTLDKAGSGYTLVVTSEGVATATTNTFAVTPGAPSQLAIVNGPANTAAGEALPTVTVAIRDAHGNLTPATTAVAIDLAGAPGTSLGGTTTHGASAGTAAFSDLSITRAGTYTLVASAAGLTSAATAPFTIVAAAPDTMAIEAGNDLTATVSTTTSSPPRVRVADRYGNPVSGAVVSFVVTNGGGSVAPGSVTTDANGIGGASTWTLGSSAGANALEARLGSLVATFRATATMDAAAHIAIVSGDGQSGTVGTALAPFVVRVTDSHGNAVPGVSVAWTATNGSLAASTATGADGTASNTMLLGTVATASTAAASVAGIGSVTFNATPNAGPPAALAILGQPTSGSAGATLDAITVGVRDAFGNATTATGSVSIAIVTNPSAATLSGTTPRSAVNGVATFDNLSIDQAGTGYALRASSTGLTPATTQPIDIAPAGTQVLAFVTTVANGTAGVAVNPAVVVEIRDGQGGVVTGATNAVTLSVQSGPSGAITGAGPVNAVSGVATFSNLVLPVAGTYTLRASASGFAASTSNSFTVSAGTPARLTIVAGDDQVASAGTAVAVAPRVLVADANGNPVSGASVNFAVTAGGGSLRLTSGGSPVTSGEVASDANGHAALDAWLLGAGANALEARLGTLAASFSATGSNGAAASIAIVAGNDQSAAVATALAAPLAVRVVDASSNPVAGAVVIWSATNGSLARVTVTGADGTTSNSLTLGTTAGGASVTATLAGGQSVTFAATAQPGPVARLVFTTQPASTSALATMSPVVVTLRDAYGNATSSNAPVTIAIAANPSNGLLRGSSTRIAANGIATFDDLSIDLAGAGYSLRASSGAIDATSQAFNVATAPAAAISIVSGDAQSATVGQAVAQPLVVRVTDGAGNAVANATVMWNARRGALGSPYTATNGDGSTANTLILSTVAGTDTITASVNGHVVSFVAIGSAAGGVKLVFLVPPGTTSYSATTTTAVTVPTTIQVAVQDAYGNVVTGSNAAITVALDNGNGALLSGAPTTTVVNGVANFPSLSVNRVGAYTVTATSPGITSATSLPIVVSFGR